MKKIKLSILVIIAFIGNQNSCYSQYHEGDTLKFWSVTYIDWPPLIGSPQREVTATCKKAGNHCYVFVENEAIQPPQSQIDTLVHKFDSHFYDSLTSVYGPIPNVFDNDSNIFILVLNESNWGGYYDPAQQMSDSIVFAKWNRHSSQRELIYIASNSFFYAGEMVAHEFGHLLHWQQDHSPEPIINPIKFWEEAWVDEGFSTFAEIFLTENIYQNNIYNQSFFANNPDIPLIYFSDYNQVRLFMLFMYEHFGKWNYISALISNQLNGICGVDSTLKKLGYSETFDDAFEQWTIANFVDDSVYANGKFNYKHYNFPPCFVSNNHSAFPTSINNCTVTPYGSDYISFYSSTPKSIIINFSGQANAKFRVDFILKNTTTNQIDSIISLPLNSQNQGTFITNNFGTDYNKIIMVVMNVDSAIHEGSYATYTYSAENSSGIEDVKEKLLLSVVPNPVKDSVNIVMANNNNTLLEIIDVKGKIHFRKNFNTTTTINISKLAKGNYVLRLTNNRETLIEKIVKE